MFNADKQHCLRIAGKPKKNVLSTRRKMKVLSYLNSKHMDSKGNGIEKNVDEIQDECIFEHGKEVLTFLQNEQVYIEHLKELQQLLSHPMLRGSIPSLENLNNFVNEMLLIHENLHNVIISGECNLAEALNQLSSNLKLYTSYSRILDMDITSLQKFLKFYKGNTDDCQQLLREPLSHIARYKKIFENLCNAMPDEPQYRSILCAVEKALTGMEMLSSLRKNYTRMYQIQKLFINRNPKIIFPGRLLLKEGYLFQVKCKKQRLKKQVAFLFSDILLCCRVVIPSVDYDIKESLKCIAVFPLNICTVSSVMGSNSMEGTLFKINYGNLSYLFLCKIPGEGSIWIQEIQTAIKKFKDPSTEGKPALNLKRNVAVKSRKVPFLRKAYRSESTIKNKEIETEQYSTDLVKYGSVRSFYEKFIMCRNVTNK
ncbi:uncharacterized protein LOC118193353 [Stegodyphus dumicola]|uniref:uncharacterized protein LOC118193353 n=1 Tax=Stegodyphus dumicola TaxID=202533 RepID=UPI0015AABA72|nr:uncharacterized protein LOC118193353 [Stegodyphus dumicola]